MKKLFFIFFFQSFFLHTYAQTGCISGDCVNGQGTYVWPNGCKYVGAWENGHMEGAGEYTSAAGQILIGEFKNSYYIGKATNPSLTNKNYKQGSSPLNNTHVYDINFTGNNEGFKTNLKV